MSSYDKGRAYEYAWIQTLYEVLAKLRQTRIIENSSLDANKRAWDKMPADIQEMYLVSANAATENILELEPILSENEADELTLKCQKDDEGIIGDVRDIVIKRNNLEWEIGLSVKHNHEAAKHSRLSHCLDFGKKWFDMPCSHEYWVAVTPIFDRLKKEKSKGKKWSELPNKNEEIYIPLLQAFIDEVNRAYAKDKTIPVKMMEYIIGVKDYYKVISKDRNRLTLIETFNIHDTLNKPSKVKVSAINVPVVELPTKMYALEFKENSENTVEMSLNNGWALSFRIHNAKTQVEPSLKFDIQFLGRPVEVLEIKCEWNQRTGNK